MEPDSSYILDSLSNDLERLHQKVGLPRLDKQTDRKDYSLSICIQMRENRSRKTGYPRLYLLAWDILIDSLRLGNDYSTLKIIHGIYQRLGIHDEVGLELGEVSLWHLKTVLYCWAYLRNNEDITAPRRAGVDATALLDCIASTKAFINMPPDDAALKILSSQTRKDTKPFLFRISTTYPGSIAISFLTPVTNEISHMRVNDPIDIMAMLSDGDATIYHSLWNRLTKGKTYITKGEAALYTKQLDYRMGDRAIQSFLSSLYGPMDKNSSYKVYEALETKFFGGIVPQHIPAQSLGDKLGITDSYRDSYTLSSNATCFQCKTFGTVIREPLGNKVYCTNDCYLKDCGKCY